MRRVLVTLMLLCTTSAAALAEPVRFSLRDAASTPAAVGAPASEWNYQDEVAAAQAPLSPPKAVLYSLLLPGLGDWKLGNKNRATVFFAVEGLIWVSFATFQVQGGDYEEEYEDLAARFAGVSRSGHSDDFYATIRDYDSSDEYEADIKNEGRYYDTGSEALEQYFIENRVEDYEPWLWASTERRLQYSETRSASKTAYRRADYMIAAAAANRVVSAVFAYAAARNAAKHEVGVNLDISPRGDVVLELTKQF
ncbi:MAG TPA: hypothetical protein VFU38_08870 [Candidatus Krumholzibacteria bacterium]|nr:hypothetical protein [Candidatus Krumholzibacteria bacterium]